MAGTLSLVRLCSSLFVTTLDQLLSVILSFRKKAHSLMGSCSFSGGKGAYAYDSSLGYFNDTQKTCEVGNEEHHRVAFMVR